MKSRSVGTKFMIDDKAVGSLSTINGVEVSSETTDVTDLGNKDGYKEFLGGFKDGGEVAVEGFLDGADEGQTAMYEAFEGQEVHACKIVFPDAIGKIWSFNGVVTRYKAGDAATNDALKFAGAVKVSGKPTLAASAAAAQTTETTQEG